MEYHTLGSTGLRVSAVSFSAETVSQLLVGDRLDAQRETIPLAVDLGVHGFDTAATYGDGPFEANLGRVLAELGAARAVHVATWTGLAYVVGMIVICFAPDTTLNKLED